MGRYGGARRPKCRSKARAEVRSGVAWVYLHHEAAPHPALSSRAKGDGFCADLPVSSLWDADPDRLGGGVAWPGPFR